MFIGFVLGCRTLEGGGGCFKMTVLLLGLSKAGNYRRAERLLDFQAVDFVQTTKVCTLAWAYVRGIC